MSAPTLDAFPPPPAGELDETVADARAAGIEISLGATIAAPLPEVVAGSTNQKATLTSSVLPRVEPAERGVRLVPSEGPRYENRKLLGEGGMGEVALALDRDIGRTVALKRLRGQQAQGGAGLARFVDEVRTVGQLEHPNIVPIHDVGVDEHGNYFFVMKYVEGETLEAIIERLKANDPDAVRYYTFQKRTELFVGVLRALDYAHQHGILHRDIKPANIMVGKNGEVILMDWGVARPLSAPERDAPAAHDQSTGPNRASATHVGSLIGTPLYMSPEQASGRNSSLDARSDLYSACQVFYELLSLHHRHEDKTNLVQLLASIQTTDRDGSMPEFARAHLGPAHAPPDLIHFVRRGLALAPGDRWQSAADMLFELDAILDGRCRVQCPGTAIKRGTRGVTRFLDHSTPRAIAVVSVAATSLLALIGVAIYGLVT